MQARRAFSSQVLRLAGKLNMMICSEPSHVSRQHACCVFDTSGTFASLAVLSKAVRSVHLPATSFFSYRIEHRISQWQTHSAPC
jgi:hypothetical protein